MGKMEFSCETSVVSHTIAFQAFLAKKKRKNISRVNCDNFLVYDGKKLGLDPKTGILILFYFRIPEN